MTRLLQLPLCLWLACASCASQPPPKPAAAQTPADRLREDARRRQREEDDRRNRDEFIHRNRR